MLIQYQKGKFNWNTHLLTEDGLPRVALVYAHSSKALEKWADTNGVVMRNFGDGRTWGDAVTDFNALVASGVRTVATSHRLELLCNDVNRPDCLFIVPPGGDVAVPMWTRTDKELRFSHNMQKLFQGGMFY